MSKRASHSRDPYQCIRCGYSTKRKDDMRKHLYSIKSQCPTTKNDLELTEEIKQHILNYRVYKPPVNKPNTQITNYNLICNFVGKMTNTEKLEHLLNHTQQKLIDFEDGLESKFESKIDRLANDNFNIPYQLEDKDLYGLINNVTRIDADQFDRLNIIFDKKVNRILFYSCQQWDSTIADYGIIDLVRYLQSYLLNSYEQYLIRNIHGSKYGAQERCDLKKHLEIYYRFIISLGLNPYVCSKNDEEIIGYFLKDNNEYYLEEYYLKWFEELKQEVKQPEKNNVKKQIIKILKDNTSHNVQELNNCVLNLIKADQTFKEQILKLSQT
jgi:hypothetical protein